MTPAPLGLNVAPRFSAAALAHPRPHGAPKRSARRRLALTPLRGFVAAAAAVRTWWIMEGEGNAEGSKRSRVGGALGRAR